MTANPPGLWAVVGPTGSGKTALSLELAEKLTKERGAQAHIVNADSMQLYRGMDIGTAKITEEEMRGIPHHLFDVLEVTEEATVAWYQPLARKLIKRLLAEGSDVILVGGSGLYVSSVIYDFDFPPRDERLRNDLRSRLDVEGVEALLAELAVLDPEASIRVDARNPRRVLRALEVAKLGQTAITALPKKPKLWHENTRILGVFVPREQLVKKLEERVENMWRDGLVAEVQTLVKLGLPRGQTASRAIGYAAALAQLNGDLTEAEALAETKTLTRRYARRQVSWFKRYPEIQWFSPPIIGEAAGKKWLITFDDDAKIAGPDTISDTAMLLQGGVGIIRIVEAAVEAKTNQKAAAALQEEPNLKWFLTFTNTLGEQKELSGSGLLVAVKYLLEARHISLQDRRETIAVGAPAGVKDALLGLQSISADLGRWRINSRGSIDQFFPWLKIDLAGRHLIFVTHPKEPPDLAKLYRSNLITDVETVAVAHLNEVNSNGVGEISVAFYDRDGRPLLGGGSAAAAAALAVRNLTGPGMPHHWRVNAQGLTVSVRMFPTEEGEHVSMNAAASLSF